MNQLEELFKITEQLEQVVSQEITAENRAEVIESINRLVEERGQHMEKISSPYTEEEKEMGKDLIILNNHIQEKLDQLFETLKKEMKQVKKQKKSNKLYLNPYESAETVDGMFMDRKK